MKITSIEYSKTVQTGKYEPETLTVSAVLEEGENAVQEIKNLKNIVNAELSGVASAEAESTMTIAPAPEKKAPAKKATKKVAKKVTKKAAKNVTYDPSIEGHKSEFKILLKEYAIEDFDVVKRHAKVISETMTGEEIYDSEGKTLATFCQLLTNTIAKICGASEAEEESKIVAFDKGNQDHTSIIKTILKEEGIKPNKAISATIKTAMASLEGKDFLDDEANLIESFKVEFLSIVQPEEESFDI